MQFTSGQVHRFQGLIDRVLGRAVLELLAAPGLEDVALNPDGKLWAKFTNENWATEHTLEREEAESLIDSVAIMNGRHISNTEPILETVWPGTQQRFTAVYPPVTTGPAFSLRIGRSSKRTLATYALQGILTDSSDPVNHVSTADSFFAQARGATHEFILRAAITARKNIVIAGGTGSGKTRLAESMLAEIQPYDRLIYIEDTSELDPQIENQVGLLTNEDVSHSHCIRTAMRLRPTRIVLGEARGGEVLALLKAWGTGHPGGICTVHANSARQALEQLARLASEGTSERQESWIAQAVNLVVYIEEDRMVAAGRKVRSICAVTGYTRDRGFDVIEL